jgi:hypothetical protein
MIRPHASLANGKKLDKLFDLCFIGFDLKAGGEKAIIG